MLLTITSTTEPATDLGYLLHKHPARFQTFDTSFGAVHVFFPEADAKRCTAALLLDVDPVRLIRGRQKGRGDSQPLYSYINDRPYVASSFLSVAMARIYGTALSGRCKDIPELAETPLPLAARLTAVPDSSGGDLLQRLFEPLGYCLDFERHRLDERFPDWGDSDYFTIDLKGRVRLSDLLAHLYVLVPVLDDHKHYWVTDQEVDKLLKHGEGWLANHPEQELIARRYLRHQRTLSQAALEQLRMDESWEVDALETARAQEEEELEERVSLREQRLTKVLSVLKSSGAKRVADLGCGEGSLLRLLLGEEQFTEIVGLDVSHRALEIAQKRLNLDRMPAMQQERVRLLHGSLVYRDARLAGFDAAALVEVIEHMDPPQLAAAEQVVFAEARPGMVVVTTPNAEYNCRFETLPAGTFRHHDHRFEWTRSEFQAWSGKVADRFGYTVEVLPIGVPDPEVGAPGQAGVFRQ